MLFPVRRAGPALRQLSVAEHGLRLCAARARISCTGSWAATSRDLVVVKDGGTVT